MTRADKWAPFPDTRPLTPAPKQLYQVTDILSSHSKWRETRGCPQDTVRLRGQTDHEFYFMNIVYGFAGGEVWTRLLGVEVRRKPLLEFDPGWLVGDLELSQKSHPRVVEKPNTQVNIQDIFG